MHYGWRPNGKEMTGDPRYLLTEYKDFVLHRIWEMPDWQDLPCFLGELLCIPLGLLVDSSDWLIHSMELPFFPYGKLDNSSEPSDIYMEVGLFHMRDMNDP